MKKSKHKLFKAASDVVVTLIALPESVCPITCAALALYVMFAGRSADGADDLDHAVVGFINGKGRAEVTRLLMAKFPVEETGSRRGAVPAWQIPPGSAA